MTDDIPMFARSVLGGKKTAKLEARVSDDLKETVRRRWVDLGFESESQYLEYLATVDCYGVEHVRMVHERRLSMVRTLSATSQTGALA
ncbi:hypothetical protein [Variovorax sp. PMC12]|uniref:hypothetical protein n=1 Tax=Variovorax sp. PMC12 TaxID=2126319 RepID=UPI00131C01BD|nr:hypothetical protein [Variovorax sp. PMC12]